MRIRRMAAIGLVAMTGLALTACTTAASTPTTGPSGSVDASGPTGIAQVPGALALGSALTKIGATSYNFTIKQGGGLDGHGSVDPTAHNVQIELTGQQDGANVDIQALQVGTDLYAKFDGGALINGQLGLDPSKWFQLDQSKLTGADAKPFDATSGDALNVAGLMAGLGGVRQTDPTHLSGTVDLTKATGVNAPSNDDLKTGGDAAKTTPFTATLDDQGRITELNVNADGFDKSMSFDVTFSSFGAATPVTAPAAADVVPAPAAFYNLLNS